MTDNVWAEPDGAEDKPRPVRYLIRKYLGPSLAIGERFSLHGKADPEYTLGEVEEHETAVSIVSNRYYHGLAPGDQMLSDQIVRLVQEACRYFYEPHWTPMSGVPEVVVSDEDVAKRIVRLNRGENTREAARTHREMYDLEKLPWGQQRALVERIEALKAEWSFQILGERLTTEG